MKRIVGVFMGMVVFVGFVVSAMGQDTVQLAGKVVSANAGERTFVGKLDKTGEDVTVQVGEKKQIHCYRPGTMEDLKDGADVKVYGTVAEDLSQVTGVGSICVMPVKSLSTDKKSRVDGVLAVQDGKYGLKRGDVEVGVQLKEKCGVSVVTLEQFDAIQPDVKFAFTAVKEGDVYVPRYEMRIYGPALTK